MTNYQKTVFDANELVAITVTDQGGVSYWGADKTSSITKVFQDKNGKKAVLYLYSHWKFEDVASKAPYCLYHQMWFGEFPYGSWCWAIRKCLISNKVKIWEICTDINPRGLSNSESWIKECKSYVPDNVVTDLIAT